MHKVIIIVCMLLPTIAFSQYTDKCWILGDSAKIDFKTGVPITGKSKCDSRGSCASICDSGNNLLFYANTTRKALFSNTVKSVRVYNKNNVKLTNGDSLIGLAWYKELLIIPAPLQFNLFYILQEGSIPEGLYYSIVDMNANNGKGVVIQKNNQLEDSTFLCTDGLAAIKHGNGRDWWVICRDWGHFTDTFYFYLATPNGITFHHTQKISDSLNSSFYRIEPSNDGSKIACCTNKGFLSTFDFDRCTGLFSNEVNISHEKSNPSDFIWYWDCELSANNKYLYVSKVYGLFSNVDTCNQLLRYDLSAPNIQTSCDTLFTYCALDFAGLIELAPDNKMYWTFMWNDGVTPNYPFPDSVYNQVNTNLSVINYPDSSFCDFQPFSFYLGGKRTYNGLPNNPNYELGPLVGSPCDTLSASSPPAPQRGEQQLHTTYVAAWAKLFINASGLKGKSVTVTIYDAKGSLKFEVQSLKSNAGYFTLDVDCGGWSAGLYVVHLETEKEKLSKKFIKE